MRTLSAVAFAAAMTILCLTLSVALTNGLPKYQTKGKQFPDILLQGKSKLPALDMARKQDRTGVIDSTRTKRTTEIHIPESECVYMTTEEGDFYHKAISPDGTACGAYISAEPDQLIEIRFNSINVPCENGGLVVVVDGWELNGEYFPTFDDDHTKPRLTEICGQRKVKKLFISSQNAALIQYRMPARGTSFSFSVRFLKNPTPCNVMLQDVETLYTIRNYGRRSNCSLSTLYPAYVKVDALNVGVTPSMGRGIEMETGTIHKCQKRGLDDYVQIGGSSGLDNRKLIVADSMCGLDSKPGHHGDMIGCGTTTVRLVSSGAFDNSVTVSLRQMTENDIVTGFMSVTCESEEKK